MCTPEANCCIECHATYEEEHCGPYLPPEILEELREYHRRLKAAGFPRRAMQRHAQWELPIFARYVPPEILAQIEVDHFEEFAGTLGSRE